MTAVNADVGLVTGPAESWKHIRPSIWRTVISSGDRIGIERVSNINNINSINSGSTSFKAIKKSGCRSCYRDAGSEMPILTKKTTSQALVC